MASGAYPRQRKLLVKVSDNGRVFNFCETLILFSGILPFKWLNNERSKTTQG